jgi:hypothetical protein
MAQDRDAVGETIAQRFATEKGRLLPLFETRTVASEVMYPEVSRRALA